MSNLNCVDTLGDLLYELEHEVLHPTNLERIGDEIADIRILIESIEEIIMREERKKTA